MVGLSVAGLVAICGMVAGDANSMFGDADVNLRR